MSNNGQTTLVRRVLERRADKIALTDEGTTATVAVMVRVLPPPQALCVFGDLLLREQIGRQITADVLDAHFESDEHTASEQLAEQFWPVVMTDSLAFVRTVRARSKSRPPFVLYVSELDEFHEREAGLIAGADECVGRRASDREIGTRIASARRIAELESVLRITLEENRKLSATDDLTRTASRRFFGKHFPREVERAARYGRALALIICDIDHFKDVNDTFGHPSGDQVLKQFGRRVQEELRRGVDWVARIGGEEFAIVLPETEYERALDVARKLRMSVAQSAFKLDQNTVRLTASFGLCGLDRVPAGERRLAERMLKIADQALYRSKETGRNRVTATLLNRPAGASGADPKRPATNGPAARALTSSPAVTRKRDPAHPSAHEEAHDSTRLMRVVRVKPP